MVKKLREKKKNMVCSTDPLPYGTVTPANGIFGQGKRKTNCDPRETTAHITLSFNRPLTDKLSRFINTPLIMEPTMPAETLIIPVGKGRGRQKRSNFNICSIRNVFISIKTTSKEVQRLHMSRTCLPIS